MTKLVPSLQTTGLETDYPKGALIEPHSHDVHQIVHSLSGVMRVTAEPGTWVVAPGRALWLPAGSVHDIRCTTAVSMRTVYVDGHHPKLPDICAVWRVTPLLREVLLRLATGPSKEMRQPLIDLLVMEAIQLEPSPLQLPRPKDQRLRRAMAIVTADPGAPHALKHLAGEVGASPRTLMRLFEAETGETYRQWRRQVRMALALERLAEGHSVTTTALDLGYQSPSAFAQAFRETFGETPGAYVRGR